jgi:uncharacterized protein (TIGR03437 family)
MKRQFALGALALAIPIAAWADISGTATVNSGQNFNFDTGQVVSSGGDISFTGSAITYVGSAKGGNLGALGFSGSSGYANVTPTILQALAGLPGAATNTPILASTITAGTSNGSVLALQTNGGNAAKYLVTAISSSSISFQYTTFGASGGGGGGSTPTLKDVQNNSSLTPNGFPNSGVAPSTLIVVHGNNMANPGSQAVLQDSTKGLPTTLNGASANVAAGGKTYPLAFYYAIPTQAALVLPAAVPTGPATLTYTFSGATASMNFNVVPSAFGIDAYGSNQAVVQDSISGSLIDFNHSAKPGQIVTVWGSGLGSNPADSDTMYTTSPHTISTPVQAWLGGVQATDIKYSGASVYPGVHILVFTVPQGVPNSCFNPLVIVTGSGNPVDSNTPIVPVMGNGGVCTDAYTGLTGSTISNLTSQTNVRNGSVSVFQSTMPATNGSGSTVMDIAFAGFQQTTGSGYEFSAFSVGACSLTQSISSSGGSSTSTGLDAGTVSVTGPSGTPVTLSTFPTGVGNYFAQLASNAIPTSGGTFTFNGKGGSGSNAVGAFTASINFPNPILSWTNQAASATVSRTAGQTYTWTGGAPGTFVIMSGSSTANGVSGSYSCISPVEAQTFTVPSYILYGLPAGSGTSMIENSTAFSTFTATGLDYGVAFGGVSFTINSVWN